MTITNMFKLIDQVREATRRLHYNIRTEAACVFWAKRFTLFHGKRHPPEMGEPQIVEFLTHLAVHEDVTPPRGLKPAVPQLSYFRWGGETRISNQFARS